MSHDIAINPTVVDNEDIIAILNFYAETSEAPFDREIEIRMYVTQNTGLIEEACDLTEALQDSLRDYGCEHDIDSYSFEFISGDLHGNNTTIALTEYDDLENIASAIYLMQSSEFGADYIVGYITDELVGFESFNYDDFCEFHDM